MGIKLSKQEILGNPNDMELGSYARRKYILRQELMKQENDILDMGQIPDDEPEICLVCGKVSPYNRLTHIDSRVGFVEGAGQGCFTPEKCLKKNK